MNVNGKYPNGAKGDADEAVAALAALTDAQRRAAEQRLAAEKLAEDARQLEERLAAEAEKARHAADHAHAIRLQQAADHARIIEAEAAEQAEACAAKQERKANDRAAAEAHSRECQAVHESAAAEVAKFEALLAEARGKLEHAKSALAESADRESRAISAEDAARVEAAESAQLLHDRRSARENIEEELRLMRERFKGFEDDVPSLETIDQLDELEARRAQISEAARRIAERRAADAARRALRP